MCLFIDSKATLVPPTESLTIYKVVMIWNKTLYAPLYRTYKYNSGYNNAIGEINIKKIYDIETIEAGIIHCYTDKFSAIKFASDMICDTAILEVIGESSDFVAYGKCREIGFKKIYISREEIKKALND